MTRRIRHHVAALIGLSLAPGVTRAQSAPAAAPVVKRTPYEDLQMFGQVLNQIRVNHPDTLDMHELYMAAVDGMIRAADPHSYVIRGMRMDAGREAALREGRLQQVPIAFVFAGGAPIVASVAAGTAARQLDILPGDELVAIAGEPVRTMNSAELDIVLAGPRKSTVKLAFERRRADGTIARLEREVKREAHDEESAVPVSVMLDSVTGYVRVTTFMGERVADDLHAALERLERTGMRRLLLDLRDNGGGSVAEAARVAGEFLPKGAIVYTSDGRKAEVSDTGRVGRSFWRSERRYPISVLVNAGTASASELIAGALQDHDRAVVVGRPTFGKSLLMRGFPMSDGSVLMLVIGQVRTPCGRVVQRQYRDITRRDYYRLARAERDTASRPSCTTVSGRTVYGGGGIYPDLLLAEPRARPRWALQVEEQQLPLTWAGGYVEANAASLVDLEVFAARSALPASALADFRSYATRQGVTIPADGDAVLQPMLAAQVAESRWGSAGAYRVAVKYDTALREAMGSFARAAELLQGAGAPALSPP